MNHHSQGRSHPQATLKQCNEPALKRFEVCTVNFVIAVLCLLVSTV